MCKNVLKSGQDSYFNDKCYSGKNVILFKDQMCLFSIFEPSSSDVLFAICVDETMKI